MRVELVGLRLGLEASGPVLRLIGQVFAVACVLFGTAALGQAGQRIGIA